MGLDRTFNEALKPELRTLDQMCLSSQYFFMGAFHVSGVMMAVFGYEFMIKAQFNFFADMLGIPCCFAMIFYGRFFKSVTMKFANHYKVWMVPGESDVEEDYDLGPGQRGGGDLPDGMGAVELDISDAVNDVMDAGYSTEQIQDILEQMSMVAPGTPLNIGGGGGDAMGAAASIGMPSAGLARNVQIGGGGKGGPVTLTPEQMQLAAAKIQGLVPAEPQLVGSQGWNRLKNQDKMKQTLGLGAEKSAADVGFDAFMDAFRQEVEESQSETRKRRFVPAREAMGVDEEGGGDTKGGDEMFDMDGAFDPLVEEEYGSGESEGGEFEDWPDELMTGIAISGDDDLLTTSMMIPYEEEDGEESDEEWPDELMLG